VHTGISLFLLFLLSILTDAHAHEKIYRIFPFLLIIWFLTKNLVMCFSIIKWAKASDAITLYKAVSDYKWLCFKLVVIHGFIKLKKVLAFLAAVFLDSRDLFKLHVNQIIQNAIQRFLFCRFSKPVATSICQSNLSLMKLLIQDVVVFIAIFRVLFKSVFT